jgi:RNA polymerase sigma-70 factor, ECF subfamily
MLGVSMQERAGLGEALEGHREMLLTYLVMLVHEPHTAEDLVQEVFAEVLSNPRFALKGDDFGAYLRGMARHLASRHFRKVKLRPKALECIEAAWEPPTIDADPGERESFLAGCKAALERCLQELPKTWRILFDFRYTENRSYADIGAATQMNSAAVRMNMTRIRRRLADCVETKVAASL